MHLKMHEWIKNLFLSLKADDIRMIRWYVDALYASHDNCHGHTGAMLTFKNDVVAIF